MFSGLIECTVRLVAMLCLRLNCREILISKPRFSISINSASLNLTMSVRLVAHVKLVYRILIVISKAIEYVTYGSNRENRSIMYTIRFHLKNVPMQPNGVTKLYRN